MIFQASGGEKFAAAAEAPTMAFAFGSVVAIRDIAPGERLTEDNLWVRRPGGGDYNAADYDGLLGKVLIAPVSRGARLTRAHLSKL